MRACRIGVVATLTLSVILSIVLATFEAIAFTEAIAIDRAIRSWGLAILSLGIVAALGLAILDRQGRILDRLDRMRNAEQAKSKARREFEAIQRRYDNGDRSNVTDLYHEGD